MHYDREPGNGDKSKSIQALIEKYHENERTIETLNEQLDAANAQTDLLLGTSGSKRTSTRYDTGIAINCPPSGTGDGDHFEKG